MEYEFTPGIRPEEDGDGSLLFGVEYHADIPIPANGFSDVGNLAPAEGGLTTSGSRLFPLPPEGSRSIWFDFFLEEGGDDGDPTVMHRISRLKIDLATGQAFIDRDPS
jgi:hypothetical protein